MSGDAKLPCRFTVKNVSAVSAKEADEIVRRVRERPLKPWEQRVPFTIDFSQQEVDRIFAGTQALSDLLAVDVTQDGKGVRVVRQAGSAPPAAQPAPQPGALRLSRLAVELYRNLRPTGEGQDHAPQPASPDRSGTPTGTPGLRAGSRSSARLSRVFTG